MMPTTLRLLVVVSRRAVIWASSASMKRRLTWWRPTAATAMRVDIRRPDRGHGRPARYRDRQGEDLSGARPVGQPLEVLRVVVGRPPFGGQDEQGPPVRAAEHQRERCPALAKVDALQDLTALGDAHDHGHAGG